MANKLLVVEGGGTPDQIVFCDHDAGAGDGGGDFNPTAANDLRDATAGNRTAVQLALASLAAASGQQSVKADLGATRAPEYFVRAAIEYAAGIDAGETVSLYWAPSPVSTAGTANAGGVTGTSAAYAGYAGDSLTDSLEQLIFIGSARMAAKATGTIQIVDVGYFRPPHRYGSLVVVNNADDALHSDDVEMHIVFDPYVPELQ